MRKTRWQTVPRERRHGGAGHWQRVDNLRERNERMRADIVPGGTFPDYALTDHTKTRRRLSELQGIDPMILVLSRGPFCPTQAARCRRTSTSRNTPTRSTTR